MVHAVIYAMRGWIAFVAFIEYSNAIRCFIDEKQFLQNYLVPQTEMAQVGPILARLFGRYFLLNGVILTHCALFIHHMPIISLSISALSLSILLHLSETFYYYASILNFYVIFPTFVSLSTIVCLFIAPVFIEDEPRRRLNYEEDTEEEDDYETKIIKQKMRPRTFHSDKLKTQ